MGWPTLWQEEMKGEPAWAVQFLTRIGRLLSGRKGQWLGQDSGMDASVRLGLQARVLGQSAEGRRYHLANLLHSPWDIFS